MIPFKNHRHQYIPLLNIKPPCFLPKPLQPSPARASEMQTQHIDRRHACALIQLTSCAEWRVVHHIFSFEEFLFFCLFRFWVTCLCKYITLIYSWLARQEPSNSVEREFVTRLPRNVVFLITRNTGNMFIHTLIVRQSQHDKDAVVWACQARNISWERNRASTIWGLQVPKPCLTEPKQQERRWGIQQRWLAWCVKWTSQLRVSLYHFNPLS